MKFNTNSNTYIIIYSVVMVVIVAVLLSLAALGLKSRQDENILNEKKTQIVKALGEDPATVAYDSVIAKAVILDAAGNVVSEDVGEVFTALNDLKGSFAAERFPLFIANSGVVVPLYGAGLWGPIWGYVGLEKDLKTIKAVCFGHKGETPGLGAKIADEPSFAAAFTGKTVGEGEILFEVCKPANAQVDANSHIDAISGATITSQALGTTLNQWFGFYKNYFTKNAASEEVVEDVVLDVEPVNTVEE